MFPFWNHFCVPAKALAQDYQPAMAKQRCQHFCKCYAANKAHTQVSLMHVPFTSNQASSPPLCTKISQCFSTPAHPRNGLVPAYDIKVICWFDKIGSRSCHMRFPALLSGNILFHFFCVCVVFHYTDLSVNLSKIYAVINLKKFYFRVIKLSC